jgi:hypothetical protein
LTKRVIAFACAVEPLAFNVFLPPQLTPDDDAAPEAPLDALVPDEDEDELLLLPHAANTSALAATRLSAAPDRLSFTELL